LSGAIISSKGRPFPARKELSAGSDDAAILCRSPLVTGRSHDNQRAAGINRPFFDVTAAEQVLGTSHWPVENGIGLGSKRS
jgi:hypothetical protein